MDLQHNALAPLSLDKFKNTIYANYDATAYFFSKADSKWLKWLWENGFLSINQNTESTPVPILSYLQRMAKLEPEAVGDIVNEIELPPEKLEPFILGRLIDICNDLPANTLNKLIPKIKTEKWVVLSTKWDRYGYNFSKMLSNLATAAQYSDLIILSEEILSLRTEEYEGRSHRPFYFDSLKGTGVLTHLMELPDDFLKQALDLLFSTIKKIAFLAQRSGADNFFEYQDSFSLYMGIFSLTPELEETSDLKNDSRYVLSVAKVIYEKYLKNVCKSPESKIKAFDEYISSLPNCKTFWMLKLYVLTLYPKVFLAELKDTLFKFFDVPKPGRDYYEYYRCLEVTFEYLTEADKRNYVMRLVSDNKLDKIEGSKIASSIRHYIANNAELKDKVLAANLSLYEENKAPMQPKIGTITPTSPTSQDELNKLTVPEIVEKLKTEWTAQSIWEKYGSINDFYNPINPEGVGRDLRENIANRLEEYIKSSRLFFSPDDLEEHYTYSFIWGIQEAVKRNKNACRNIEWKPFFDFCTDIKIKFKVDLSETSPKRDPSGSWTASWKSVIQTLADLIQELINNKDGQTAINFEKYRTELLEVIQYLLSSSDPQPEDEKIEAAHVKIINPNGSDNTVSDPFTIAINSVRGKGYEALFLFIVNDRENGIAVDVKPILEYVIRQEKTTALFFMFGRFIVTLFYREKQWLETLYSSIFPKENEKAHLAYASIEGYLANNLYEKVFLDPFFQELYERTLYLPEEPKSKKHFQNPVDGLATHLALAFMHYPAFDLKHKLLEKFFEKGSNAHKAKFISFIGQNYLSEHSSVERKILELSKPKLTALWEKMLNTENEEVLREFGSWMSVQNSVFDIKWLSEMAKQTLEKTQGIIDREFTLAKSLLELTKASPENGLSIIRSITITRKDLVNSNWLPYFTLKEFYEPIKLLYSIPETKNGAEKLISDLMLKYSDAFWKLKQITNPSATS